MVKIAIDIDLPTLPNFVTVGGQKVDVADVSDEVLAELGREWADALLKHAADRRMTRAASNY